MKFMPFLLGLTASALSFSLYAYSPNDHQGTIYKGLQDLNKLADTLKLDRKQQLGTIGKNNLVSSLLSAWDEKQVSDMLNETGDIKTAAKKVVHGIYSEPLYDLSGFASDKEPFLDLIERSSFISIYHPEARGITLKDTDALFIPSKTPVTKNLAGTANTATDQKSSSTLIPANTPVYILGQLLDLPTVVNPDGDSWLLVWREEFGLKFVHSSHIGKLSQPDIEKYQRLVTSRPEMVRTERVEREFKFNDYQLLMPGTMPLYSESEIYLLAKRSAHYGQTVQIGSNTWTLNYAALATAVLRSKDERFSLDHHIKQVPVKATIQNYLDDLHNVMFHYPDYVEARFNQQRSFAWGEGITGIDNQHGQDISNFVYKLMLGFGLRLPRFSGDQIAQGMSINTVFIDHSLDMESHYKTLVDHCTLGRMAAFGRNAHMVCIGSVSMPQLRLLDPEAAVAALNNGMQEDDLVALVATSPVGFRWSKTVEGQTISSWTITPKAAVFPIFKEGPYSSWVVRREGIKIFSFFVNSPEPQTSTEL